MPKTTDKFSTKCLMLCMILIVLFVMMKNCKDNFSKDKGFIELDESNFDDTIKDEDMIVFVMFYAPWCPHCTNIMDVMDELSKKLEKDQNIKVSKIDVDKHTKIGKKENIRGFPTLKLYKNGKEIEHYKGQRNVSSMEKFIRHYTV